MTVAAKDGFGGAGRKGRFVRAGSGGAANPWKRLWQVPLLVAGIGGFAWGLGKVVRAIRPVPFEQQAAGIRGLLRAGEYSKAIAQINIMGNYYKQTTAQATLQELAGDAHYLAEEEQLAGGSILVPTNFQWTEKHYENAVRLGVVPSAEMNERWGEAAMALGEAGKAAEKLERAIADATPRQRSELLEKHGKELVAAYLQSGETGRAMVMVNRILAENEAQAKDAAVQAATQQGASAPGSGPATRSDQEASAENPRELERIEEKTWALCTRIQIALAAKDQKMLAQMLAEARGAMESLGERDPMGRVLAWIGRAELEEGDSASAERDLSRARSLFAVHHLDDGRAAVLLGRIAQKKGDLEAAGKLYDEVVKSEAGTSVWAAGRLGQADVAVLEHRPADSEIIADYRYAIAAAKEVEDSARGGAPVGRAPELVSTETVETSLEGAYKEASGRDQLDDALTYLALEQEIGAPETPEVALELATTREKRGDEMHKLAQKQEGDAREQSELQARQMWADAAGAYLRHAKLTTLDDDVSGASAWKGAELLDRAGRTADAIAVYERLTIQRPRDARVSEGLLTLGRLYESAGMLEKAAASYQRNIKENPRTPAAYGSAVDLARCYSEMAASAEKPEEKEKDYELAKGTLLTLVSENPDLKPAAMEFRESVRALGELYYQRKQWPDAILRLDELVRRYPEDAGLPRALFLLAESYRNSAWEIGEALEKDPAIANRAELAEARTDRLGMSTEDFTRVIGLLDEAALGAPGAGAAHAPSVLEIECLETAYMDRAACAYELGDYEQSIRFYEQASARFPEKPLAVEAYVQIVNAYLKMKQPAEAGAAAERGRFVLKRIPDAAFGKAGEAGGGKEDRDYYEKLLTLAKS